MKNTKRGQNTSDLSFRIATNADIFREDILNLFLNEHA